MTRVLVAFVDALGPSQLARMGPLGAARHTGKLDGILGYSCAALPTLLTGTTPEHHGRMCLFSRREEGMPGILSPLAWLGLLPRVLHERGPVRRAAASLLSRVEKLSGYVALYKIPPSAFRWLDIPEREDLFSARAIGGQRTFLSRAREHGLSVYSPEWRRPEEERWEAARESMRRDPADLTFLYFTDLDGTLHREGNDSQAARNVGKRTAERIDTAARLLGRGGDDTLVLVVGDHGMADVRRTVDPRPLTARATSARVFVDSTMLRVWGTPEERNALRGSLERARIGGSWLESDDLARRHAPVRGAPFGDAVFVLEEGTIFAPSFVGGAMKGMHGYDVGTPSSHAAIASSVPLPSTCRSLSDLSGVVETALGLPQTRVEAVAS
jgi:hypothetical protein